ncbi:TetR/AcrR family transcriptional regulator [Streptomyces gobiensis]|uniref:TetR/AcrR family transcriptional regulator n=1 Tax=Streptomyces gobiensis TaxID=2875706 RepID=UPI001E4D898B|nr:TetR family transcriptional regulator C-terminal domain-containing protein [Streptomyces gobiensis]UGY90705.1 TetR family transcriptional regulator [Streptomyces gobiensis]
MGRRYDPDRRQRIIDAAIRVVSERGIAALSHRAVAAEADVPLGSTTYHFATLDDLLVAALQQQTDDWLAMVGHWERGLAPDASLAAALAELIGESMAADRSWLLMEYELYLAALRYERVRPIAAVCVDGLAEVLRRRTDDETTARALAGLTDGLTLQHLLTGRDYDKTEAEAILARAIGGCPTPGTG